MGEPSFQKGSGSGGSVVIGKTGPHADLFQMVSLEELVPPHYILRRIDAAVDFSFIRQQVADKYDAGGRRVVAGIADDFRTSWRFFCST
ncbi:hypothetical protein U7230_08110 [Carboxydochorda subterranea]|uniref:Transposase InsH N-terminal domain-containing protein n=1 Tax=Carboxydichorda subterranea TaxID=3109565 RepID=A0ABZ1C252_9FIRM|nr:hypothetical protein [Limnochorda sp. L945t]WRP18994.1 hypothetical protein U7230_08110 [Limnochorda sp. L945t]